MHCKTEQEDEKKEKLPIKIKRTNPHTNVEDGITLAHSGY